MIKFLITLAILLVPALLTYLNITHNNVEGKYLFTFFILIAMVERLWGTFYTQKGKDTRKFHGDWTLAATTFSYFFITLLIIYYFYQSNTKDLLFVILGVAVFVSGLIYRFYSMSTLGKQWNIHVTDAYKIDSERKLIISGPYKYSRHPIYFSAILELIGLSLIINSYIFIIIVLIIYVPLMAWRSLREEKQSIKIFGEDYIKYKKEVSFMIPWRGLLKK
jgi:protein-S-isoprenylcysteine O-methyltransferase Ste14